MARFFFSVPYINDTAAPYKTLMEKLYVTLIDAAKDSIEIVQPHTWCSLTWWAKR